MREIPNDPSPLGGRSPSDGLDIDPFDDTVGRPIPEFDADAPETLLVCTDCYLAFEHRADWAHCPVCAEGLLEVEMA